MPDLQPDTSIYHNMVQPANPLTTAESLIGVKNALQQQQALQMQNKLTQGQLGIGQYIKTNTDPQTGKVDANKFLSDVSQDPNTAIVFPQAMEIANKLNEAVPAGVNPDGSPKMAARQNVNAALNPAGPPQPPPLAPQQIDQYHDHMQTMQDTLQGLLNKPDLSMGDVIGAAGDLIGSGHISPQEAAAELSQMPSGPDMGNGTNLKQALQDQFNKITANRATLTATYGPKSQSAPAPTANDANFPTIQTGVPVGYGEKQAASRERINQVQNDATNYGQKDAVLSQIEDLSKSGTPSGTAIANIYANMAKTGIAPEGITKEAANMQVMAKYMAQAALASGMPASDARLSALQDANTHPEQLPQAIQALVPFLRATNESSKLKQKFYNSQVGAGLDPDKEIQAKQLWDENYDPRLVELSQLPASERPAYYAAHPELQALLPKYKQLKQMGVISGQ